jgi:hypothetical protein
MLAIHPWVIEIAKSTGIGLLMLVALFVSFSFRERLKRRLARLDKHRQQLILAVPILLWGLAWVMFWEASRNDLFRCVSRLIDLLGWGLIQVGVALAVIAFGWLAYWYKGQNQFIYGLIEVLVAMATAMTSTFGITSNRETFTRVATIVGCVYIVSRGFENMNKAIEETKKQ